VLHLICESSEYRIWCESFLTACYRYLGDRMNLLSKEEDRRALAASLSAAFDELHPNERVLRIWIKLASFVPSILMYGAANTHEQLIEQVASAAGKASGHELPWD
jgi:hypothetical protein